LIGIGSLLAILLVGPFLVPIPALEGVLAREQLADADSLFLDVNGLEVHYKIVGQGQPGLLLLHGFGASVWSWREIMSPLARYGTVVAFDRPAFGLTERPLPGEWYGPSPYATDAQVQLTVGMLDQLGMQRAVLIGNSAGGTIAILTALRFPERVQALILVSPAVREGGGMPSWAGPLLRSPQLRRLGSLAVRSYAARLERSLPTAWHDPSKVTAEVLDGYKRPLQAEDWDRAFWEYLATARPTDVEGQLHRIAMPTLVVTGDDDTWIPTAQSVRLAGVVPAGEVAVIPECGHVAMDECPAQFLEAVSYFLEALPRE